MFIMDKNIYKMEIQIYNINMFIEFSNSEKITEAIAYSLKSVWIIEADSTYDVKKGGAEKKELVALRTTRGLSKVSIEGVEDIETVEGTLFIFEHDKVKRYYCTDKQIASSLFTALFYEWLQNMDDSVDNKSQYNDEIIKSINYIKLNLNKNISMDKLAAQVGFCERR